jgi:hypothetical protein
MRRATTGHRGAILARILAGAALAVAIPESMAAEANRQEILAAVVYKLASFVEWPASAPAGYALCVHGEEPLAAALQAYHGKPARAGAVSVRRLPRPQAEPDCHVALVAGENARLLEQVALAWRGRAVLVIGEGDDAIDHGAMVGLSVSGDRVVFDASKSAADREGLALSSKLLRLARRVR